MWMWLPHVLFGLSFTPMQSLAEGCARLRTSLAPTATSMSALRAGSSISGGGPDARTCATSALRIQRTMTTFGARCADVLSVASASRCSSVAPASLFAAMLAPSCIRRPALGAVPPVAWPVLRTDSCSRVGIAATRFAKTALAFHFTGVHSSHALNGSSGARRVSAASNTQGQDMKAAGAAYLDDFLRSVQHGSPLANENGTNRVASNATRCQRACRL